MPIDSVIPLSRLRAALARPSGARRVDALLAHDDAKAAVERLAPADLFFLIKDVGLADCIELLQLASPEQFQGCLDLDIWDRDQVIDAAAAPWLSALLEGGDERTAEVWRGLDVELTALLLARSAIIYDHSLEEAVPEEEERPVFVTPDTFFTLVLIDDDPDQNHLIAQLLDSLYRADDKLARSTIMAARSEFQSTLEEYCYRWRSGRLADCGYTDYYEALEVFRPLESSAITAARGTFVDRPTVVDATQPGAAKELPVPMLEKIAGIAFLARVLDAVPGQEESERLHLALIMLVNKVLAAAQVSPGDPDAVAVASEHAAATLALGLEQVSGSKIDVAVAILQSTSLVQLHRVGYTLTLRLAKAARAIAPLAITAGEPSASVLAALLARRPFFPVALDDGRQSGGVRPFQRVDDLKRAANHLAELGARVALAQAFDVDLIAVGKLREPRPELDAYARTGIARFLASNQLGCAPLTRDELLACQAQLASENVKAKIPELKDCVATLAKNSGVGLEPAHVSRLVDRYTREISEELLALPEGFDARYLVSVIASAAKG